MLTRVTNDRIEPILSMNLRLVFNAERYKQHTSVLTIFLINTMSLLHTFVNTFKIF